MHSVSGCQFQDNGHRRVWFFRDNSQVVELLSVPLKLRFNYYDASNRSVRNKSTQAEMKKAIESFKKLRGIK
ncbi:hypothetical protein CIFRMM251M_16650 [Citrobacter freundii]|uniref:hypothetical protein n=1 Tax=Citrobacter freundii TaxID=546 RepID=UPI001A2AEA91|nr:hypothetical protein [Citrobacter freundii]